MSAQKFNVHQTLHYINGKGEEKQIPRTKTVMASSQRELMSKAEKVPTMLVTREVQEVRDCTLEKIEWSGKVIWTKPYLLFFGGWNQSVCQDAFGK